MIVRLVSASRAELRLRVATSRLAELPPGDEVLVVGGTAAAAAELVRAIAISRGSAFGMHRLTLGRLAAELAKLPLAAAGKAPIGALPAEALCARVVDRLHRAGELGRFAAVADQPGLPRALARTLGELRLAGATSIGRPLDAALAAFADELARAGLADRADVLALAARVTEHALFGHHVVMLDVPIHTAAERALVASVAARSRSLLATIPTGDDRTLARLAETLGVACEHLDVPVGGSLERVQRGVFGGARMAATLDDSLAIFSAPGESRECVEIARRIVHTAETGVPFDRMAILLRAPAQYRVHLDEALARAGVPAYFEHGTVLPDPAGRAFVALLACAAEGLSARRFAEYLSLGEVPGDVPAPAAPRGDRWVPPDEELLPRALAFDAEPIADAEPDAIAQTRAPWRWERLLVDAAVIGGRERWSRRLDGLAARLELPEAAALDPDARARMLADLAHLRGFALPLLDELAALPASAPWGVWLDALTSLATRALRRPSRVLAVLAALSPMSEVGPIALDEVRLVLAPRLTELVEAPPASRYGRVLVAPIDAARGLAFDVVFVPGLAERMFPQKLVEDPLLLDADRARLPELETRIDRLADERLALRLAIGAANRRVVLSYPRIDLDQARPRVPSFYGLEVLAAAEGTLPGFDELGQRADVTGAARIGWPAPARPLDAIDEAEHDLALLSELFKTPTIGAARYLLGSNAHLARALRARGRRWLEPWRAADGFIVSTPEGRAVLDANALHARSFSPTALEQLAACPLRFAYRTIVKLAARELPEPIQALGALERGSLVHEVQFELLGELRAAGELPVRHATLDAARVRLDAVLDRVAARYRDKLAPAIERVWVDGIASIRADLREWLRRMAEDVAWTPHRFELAFGLAEKSGRDPASVEAPVTLDSGLVLRGSIDLVELRADGAMRATDHKTGKARVALTAPPSGGAAGRAQVPAVERGSLIAGGSSLQPVLYALVLERLFPGTPIAGGRLAYCTTRGEFRDVDVALDDDARTAAQLVADTLAHHVKTGFFPAAPQKGACEYCDYRPVCGPYEEQRVRKKARDKLVQLTRLRETR